jgi:hypothetical protein
MSNSYVNQLLFGHSKRSVTKEYVDGLLPNMLTTEWISRQTVERPPITDNMLTQSPISASIVPFIPDLPNSISESQIQQEPQMKIKKDKTPMGNTLFWSIYSAMNPVDAIMQRSAANVEIDTRIKIVESLRKTPKRLKDTNAKLTMEATQGLLGAMLTAREDRIDFCVAYSVFYNKHILFVYPKTCRLFSPNLTSDIEDDDHIIILYVSHDGRKIAYSSEPNPTREMAIGILNTKPAGLKAQSNYKIPELESIAETFGISIKTVEVKRRKKEDVYNEIRVAIHNDVNFV